MIDQASDPELDDVPDEAGADDPTSDVPVVISDDEPERPRRPRRRRPTPVDRLRGLASWATFLGLSALVLRPALITAIVADDFLIPFHQYSTGGSSFVESLRIGWSGASAGHFNYIGQIIGAIVGWIWVQLTLHFGVDFSLVFATTKYLVFVGTALAAARLVRRIAGALGTDISAWRSRIYVAIALFGTLQIHVAWSNDPTVNYPMSGFASAAIGMLVLSYAVDTYLDPTLRRSITLAAAGLAGILYYEVNAAVIVAFLPLALLAAFRRDEASGRRISLRNMLYAGIPLAAPAVATVIVRLLTSPATPEEAYSGTSISTGGTLLTTFRNGLVSGLPASAWQLTRKWLDAPFVIRVIPFLVTMLVAGVLAHLHRTRPAATAAPIRSWTLAGALLLAPVGYWFAATAIQAATPKVQSESSGIGYVYNYYAVAATCVAVLLALIAVYLTGRLPGLGRTALATGVVAFLVMQFFVSWNMMRRFNEVTVPGQQLYSFYADDRPEADRCAAMDAWLGGGWPEYYRQDLINGIQWAHEEYRGEPYCERLMDETAPLPPVMQERRDG